MKMPVKPKHTGESWIVIANREKILRHQEETRERRKELERVMSERLANYEYGKGIYMNPQ